MHVFTSLPVRVCVRVLQVIALRPTDGTALCNYALLLQHVRGDAAGAQAVYREALSLAPDGLSDEENVALLYRCFFLFFSCLRTQ